MKTIYTDQHRLRDAQTALYGGELVKPFERPSRAATVIAAVRDSDLGPVEVPAEFSLASVLRVPAADFVSFIYFFLRKLFFMLLHLFACMSDCLLLKLPNSFTGNSNFYTHLLQS